MLVSLNAIKKYINLDDISIEELVLKLNLAGVEVESVSRLATGTNLVIGLVEKEEPIPDTHLHLLTVNDGKGQRQVICGADNIAKGQKIILALPGAKLPGLEIKEATVKGYLSSGMVCSLKELGVASVDEKGIKVLDKDAPLGEDPLKFLGLDDIILDLKITPNRGDLQSILGLVKEIAAIFAKEYQALEVKEIIATKKMKNNIEIKTSECSFFAIRKIENVQVTESPEWLKRILLAFNQKPINSLVDISNYILLLFGQPLHFYDGLAVGENDFIIRDDYKDSFTTLTKETRQLEQGDIVITVNQEVGCLGGVIGGLSTAINNNTTSLFLEAASFNGVAIRKTAKRLDLVSESSQRFIKGINEDNLIAALDYATYLIQQLNPQAIVYQYKTAGKIVNNNEPFKITIDDVNKRLGTKFSSSVILEIAKSLKIKVEKQGENFLVYPNLARKDIRIKEDFIEEIIRLKGFETIPFSLPTIIPSNHGLTEKQKQRDVIRNFLVDKGMFEVISYTLVDEKKLNFNRFIQGAPVQLVNPFGEDKKHLRLSLLPSLLDVASYNINRQNNNIKMFEISSLYSKEGNKEVLGIVLAGDINDHKFYSQEVNFYHIKGYLDSLIRLLGIEPMRLRYQKSTNSFFHQGRSADCIIDGKLVATLGEIGYQAANHFQLRRIYMMEIDLSLLLSIKSGVVKYKKPSPYPSISRDLAIVVDESVKMQDIIQKIQKTAGNLLDRVEVFDLYRGEGIKANQKSIALSMTFVSYEATLKDAMIKEIFDKVVKTLENDLAATIRQ